MKKNVEIILDELEQLYPAADCELTYRTPFQLLIAVVLSAQTTDKKVNDVTKDLFAEYPDLEAMLTLSEMELQNKIKKIGLYRNKSKSVRNLCIMLAEEFDGKVPDEYDDLIRLPGVGRKTANVVLSNAFSKPAIAVDTHVFRVSNRIGLAEAKDVLQTELQLMDLIPKERWSLSHHLLIWHGRRTCKAKKPGCEVCPISEYCKYYLNNNA
ncbi:MAG: endonuclease III [Clostridia bacterium]|nr:endonuclease III [Clostridia bacterium]